MQEEPDVLQSDCTVGAGDPFIAGVSLTGLPGGGPPGGRPSGVVPTGLVRGRSLMALGLDGAGA